MQVLGSVFFVPQGMTAIALSAIKDNNKIMLRSKGLPTGAMRFGSLKCKYVGGKTLLGSNIFNLNYFFLIVVSKNSSSFLLTHLINLVISSCSLIRSTV